jgi:hypothetical protein
MAKKPESSKPQSWGVYRIAKKAVWLGTVEAPDKAPLSRRPIRNSKPRYGVCRRCSGDDPS